MKAIKNYIPGLLIFSLSFLMLFFAGINLSAQSTPNIVIILADDLGYGSVGAYGAKQDVVQTPSIDRLAEEGRLFTNAYTPSSVCSPTRYGLLTGRYDWRTGMEYGVCRAYSPLHIRKDRQTIASMLKDVGYTTAAIGKWHLGYQKRTPNYYKALSPGPLDLGFDYHWGVPVNHGDNIGAWVENDHIFGMVDKMEDLPEEQRQPKYNWNGEKMLGIPAPYRTDSMEMTVITRKAVNWIGEQSAEQPFFLYFAQSAIHAPHITSPKFKGSSGGGVYGDFIQELDFSVGEIMKALDEGGFSENTLVLFTSDNGGHPSGGDEAIEAGLKINGDLRGTKLSIWEGGFKVPYILRWPGHIAARTKCREVVSLVDTYASLSALVGAKLPLKKKAAEDSYNVLPAWMDQDYEGPLRENMVMTSYEGITALRKGEWKYVDGIVPDPDPSWLFGKRLEEVNEMLFNLSEDPSEQHNVLLEYPEITEEMRALLSRLRAQGYSRN
jgi:arylsulfatase A